jgi:signal transduction histidine kinase
LKISYSLLAIFALIPFIILGASIYVVETASQKIIDNEIDQVKNLIVIQKQKIVSDFNYHSNAIEAYPKLSEWRVLSDIDKIDDENGGILESEEISKRVAAKFLISELGFQSFGITLTDGRMYFLEPFEHQSNLSKMNFSDREWFQGVASTQSTYISDVFISAASNHPIIVISTPIFSNEGEIIGMWGGSLDLDYLTGFFNEVKKEKSSILLIDENNTIIANTEHSESNQIIKNELLNKKIPKDGEDTIYFLDNEKHFFINNIEIGNKNWKMITSIDHNHLVPAVSTGIKNIYIVIGFLIGFIIVSEFLLFKFLKKNFQLNTDIKENHKLLVKQERLAAIGEVSSRIAHDIRNPLSNIDMALKLIEKNTPDTKISDESIKEKLEIAYKNIDRISHQVNNVLDYVRQRKISRKNISLQSCLDETVQLLHIPNNIKIKSDESDLKILADPIQLQIVCNNILINAIQAIGTNQGEIKFRFSENTENVIIEIENSGPSIPQELLPHIFESLVTSKEVGTGLGLSSCKRIIENHGGSISVKNNPTTFTITLPKS